MVDMEEKREQMEVHIDPAEEFASPESLYEELIAKVLRYHPSTDLSLIEKAYKVATKLHRGQERKSGEDYIIHPLSVGIILAELELDKESIVAGILHDVVEDTIMTQMEIARDFGVEIALLVDGVTKLGQLPYKADKVEVQAENLRKMFLAMAKDIRVILIKLADRLHNMRTLQHMDPAKQREKARETMDIYAPIAQRLGISTLKNELDDLSLKYLEPEAYYDLVKKINEKKSIRAAHIAELIAVIKPHLEEAQIEASVNGRAKHFFSIYKKMINQQITIEQVYDLFAIRIIVETVQDCYGALGVIHEMFKPIPGRFKDYIAMPKPNHYQSLHTSLIGPDGQPFEIQIRTFEMHRTAEYGIAAHWKYKEGVKNGNATRDHEEEKLTWLRQILEWQKEMSDNREFLDLLKSDLDLFSGMVFCFTPDGDVMNLPAGSTPIDFAYSIHSAVGNKMVGAKANGTMVHIDYKIQNGDRIEIMTSKQSKGPSRDWLKLAKSAQARNKISQWFRSQYKEENIQKGKELLQQFCKSRNYNWHELNQPQYQQRIMKKYGFREWDSVLASVGHGGIKEGQIVNKLQDYYKKDHAAPITDSEALDNLSATSMIHKERLEGKKSQSGISVKGVRDVSIRLSKCCSPVPGDAIVGYVTRGRGVSIHRKDCANIEHLSEWERARLLEAKWPEGPEVRDQAKQYEVSVQIFGYDRIGLLVDITKIFMERKIDITRVCTNISKQGIATLSFSFAIKGVQELKYIIDKVRHVESVIDVERTTG